MRSPGAAGERRVLLLPPHALGLGPGRPLEVVEPASPWGWGQPGGRMHGKSALHHLTGVELDSGECLGRGIERERKR